MKPSIATRSSRCSRSYQRLKSASCAGSTSIDVSSMPFPAIGIFYSFLSFRHARPRAGHPRLLYTEAQTWMPGTRPGMTECYILALYLRRHVRDRLHHGIAYAGIIQRVACALHDAKFGLKPSAGERVGIRGRA